MCPDTETWAWTFDILYRIVLSHKLNSFVSLLLVHVLGPLLLRSLQQHTAELNHFFMCAFFAFVFSRLRFFSLSLFAYRLYFAFRQQRYSQTRVTGLSKRFNFDGFCRRTLSMCSRLKTNFVEDQWLGRCRRWTCSFIDFYSRILLITVCAEK